MKEYRATRSQFGAGSVKVHGDPTLKRPWYVRKRLDLVHYTPDSYDWGNHSLGASQLAVALLADHFGHVDDDRAVALHKEFLNRCIARLPHDWWTLTGKDIDHVLARLFDT